MAYSLVALPSNGKVPKEVREDSNCYGAVEPKYGRLIKVLGPENSQLKMRLFFLLDVFESAPFHPRDNQGYQLPRRFRVMNPMMWCKSLEGRDQHFATSTKKELIQECGNLALVASGAFSKKQFWNAMNELRRLYGDDVKVTIVDGRKELHWLGDSDGDGEPFSQHTLTNHQNAPLSREDVISQEREFATSNSVKVWARLKDDEITPVLRTYTSVQTEEQFVTSLKNVSYIRLPVTDHSALDADTVLELHQLVKSIINQAKEHGEPVHVIWTHCLGGKGRASSLSLATHIMAHRMLSASMQEPTKISFKHLAKHIWLSGGRKLDTEPDPDKRYKYNGAVCRKGILEELFAAYNDPGDEGDLFQRIRHRFQAFVEHHQEEWTLQVDGTDFAEEEDEVIYV